LSECTAINNAVRRSALSGLRFEPIFGCDQVLLAHLAYGGVINVELDTLYLRREFSHERQDYMERMTGEKDRKGDYRQMIDMFSRELSRLPERSLLLPVRRRLLSALLEKRYGLQKDALASRLLDRSLILGWRVVDRVIKAFDGWRVAR
jgi:hypothetical protein